MKKIFLFSLVAIMSVACGGKAGKAVSDTDSLAVDSVKSIRRPISVSASTLSTSSLVRLLMMPTGTVIIIIALLILTAPIVPNVTMP